MTKPIFDPVLCQILSFDDFGSEGPPTHYKSYDFGGGKPCPSVPWCFCFLGLFLPGTFLCVFECFLPILQGFQGLAR